MLCMVYVTSSEKVSFSFVRSGSCYCCVCDDVCVHICLYFASSVVASLIVRNRQVEYPVGA